MKSLEEIKQTRNLFIEAEAPNDGMGGYYYDSISDKKLNFIFSYQLGWEHLSVSLRFVVSYSIQNYLLCNALLSNLKL